MAVRFALSQNEETPHDLPRADCPEHAGEVSGTPTPTRTAAQAPAPVPSTSTKRTWSGAIRDYRDFLYRSPALKTTVSLVATLGAGFFTNTLVTEMTDPTGTINWGSFYETVSFYVLLVFVALTYLFHRQLYLHERRVDHFRDDEFCRAYAKSQLIPEQVELYRQLIRKGDTSSFKAAMASIEKVLK